MQAEEECAELVGCEGGAVEDEEEGKGGGEGEGEEEREEGGLLFWGEGSQLCGSVVRRGGGEVGEVRG